MGMVLLQWIPVAPSPTAADLCGVISDVLLTALPSLSIGAGSGACLTSHAQFSGCLASFFLLSTDLFTLALC